MFCICFQSALALVTGCVFLSQMITSIVIVYRTAQQLYTQLHYKLESVRTDLLIQHLCVWAVHYHVLLYYIATVQCLSRMYTDNMLVQ